MNVRPAEPRDADAVLALQSGHHRAEAHQLYEGYGFEHYARAYGLKL